jgi:hypothetical protein
MSGSVSNKENLIKNTLLAALVGIVESTVQIRNEPRRGKSYKIN